MRFTKRLRRGAVYHLTRLLTAIVVMMNRKFAVFVARFAGLTALALLGRDRYRIDRHLGLAFGDTLSRTQRKLIARDFFVGTAGNVVDVMRLRRHYHREIKPLVSVEGLDRLDAAYRRGKGLIGITGHLGNFELLAAHIAALGYPVAVIGRELYDRRLNNLLIGNREAMGITNMATTDSPRRLLNWLRSGKVLGVLMDTDSFRVRGMFVPMFGRPARTPVGQSMLALRTGAAVVPIVCVRTPTNRYEIIIRPEVHIDSSGDFESDVFNLTLACNRELEVMISEFPSQWIWLHNRWRTKPPQKP